MPLITTEPPGAQHQAQGHGPASLESHQGDTWTHPNGRKGRPQTPNHSNDLSPHGHGTPNHLHGGISWLSEGPLSESPSPAPQRASIPSPALSPLSARCRHLRRDYNGLDPSVVTEVKRKLERSFGGAGEISGEASISLHRGGQESLLPAAGQSA